MTFIWPGMLLFLLMTPLFVLLYLRVQRQRRQMVARYASLGFLQNAPGRSLGIRRHIPPLFFLLSLIILIVALARPQTVVSLPRIEGTVMLAFDVSGSMGADDLKPTRIEAAKAAATAFVERQPTSVLIGVVAFSDSGLAVQTPTNDQGEILAAINRLSAQRGTSLANGILASLSAIEAGAEPPTNFYSNLTPEPTATPTPVPRGYHAPAVIVLLTDGENNQRPDPLDAAQQAADRGVRVYTVGIGSPTGATVHVEGFTVHTQLDEIMLKQISQITDGVYYNAENEEDLLSVYDNLDPQLVIKPQEMEVTPLFAGLSLLFLLTGGSLSLFWFGRLP